jgi:hypothetical protein
MEKETVQEQTPAIANGLLEKLKNYLLQNYLPVQQHSPGTFTKTTGEIYFSLQAIYPAGNYTQAEVAELLHNAGFTFIDTTGNLKFEWLLELA